MDREPGEWPQNLDLRELLEKGWRPTPFQDFIIKIHSRCNLACDYCYMYEMADQSWRGQPLRMSRPLLDTVARRIAEHARGNLLREVEITLHGGEPLLAGHDHMRYALEAFRSALASDVGVRFSLQTNGVLLDPLFLDLFAEYEVSVGVSLDGDEEGHDLHRKRKDGRGSYQSVLKGVELLVSPPYRHLFGGFLSTIDLRNDPILTYESLLPFGPPGIDFLLPHGNWDLPPPDRPDDESTPYADWLIAIFDRWYKAPETEIRLFSEIINLLIGRHSESEAVGLSPVAMVVVETNGQIEQVDSLKSAFDGAPGTALHVSRNPFNEALMLPSIAARQIGARALADACLACDLQRICGGGLYAHRYRAGSGFRNPSVYCADLMRLITHIHATVTADLAERRRRSAGGAPAQEAL
jgi:uncharacterized protein